VKIAEVDGKTYKQLWGDCNFPKCKAHYRAESHEGTSRFITHLRTAHSVVKGQQQLKTKKIMTKMSQLSRLISMIRKLV
jgi:hypothetical protein